MNKYNSTISKEELIQLGYAPHTSSNLIRQAKLIMVNSGYTFYNNKRLGRVPINVIENILGISLKGDTCHDKKE